MTISCASGRGLQEAWFELRVCLCAGSTAYSRFALLPMWKCLLWRRGTVPLQQMLKFSAFPKLTVFASGMCWTIIRWFLIVVTALLRAKPATRWRHNHCLGWRSLCRHALLNKDSGKLLLMRDEIWNISEYGWVYCWRQCPSAERGASYIPFYGHEL